MENIMKLFSRLFIVFGIITSLISCGEESALKEETIYFQKENKGWINNDSLGYNFVLIDNNGISQSFTMNRNNYEFSNSWGSFLGVNTDMTHTEYHYQAYTSNYGVSYSLSLTAGFKPFGDDLYIDLDRIGFAYDFKFQTISRLNTDFGIKSKLMTDEGYELQGEDIFSTAEILDSYSTNLHNYDTVLHFQLEDYKDNWDDFTVTDIYIAKNNGLIKYELNNGITYERK
jgi:hypothetical protein